MRYRRHTPMTETAPTTQPFSAVEGSVTWQIVFFALCAALLLRQVWSGRKQGPVRGLVNLAALAMAYCAAFFGGRLVAPLLRSFISLPDFALAVIGGFAIGLIVYLSVSGVGGVLFRKTADQESGLLRFVYGLSGALVGLVSGCLVIWILLMGVRVLGTVAENRLQAEEDASRELGELGEAEVRQAEPATEKAHTAQMAQAHETAEFILRLDRSVELGVAGAVVDQVDVVPEDVHRVLAKLSRTVANPVSVTRFMDFPGAKELTAHAKIQALRDDPEISRLAMEGQYFALLAHQKIVEAANDPVLAVELKKFDLEKALDYALLRSASPPSPPPRKPVRR